MVERTVHVPSWALSVTEQDREARRGAAIAVGIDRHDPKAAPPSRRPRCPLLKRKRRIVADRIRRFRKSRGNSSVELDTKGQWRIGDTINADWKSRKSAGGAAWSDRAWPQHSRARPWSCLHLDSRPSVAHSHARLFVRLDRLLLMPRPPERLRAGFFIGHLWDTGQQLRAKSLMLLPGFGAA
jgi:hypothetical protein